MKRKLRDARADAKTADCRKRNQLRRKRNQISDAMQAAKDLLHGKNVAWELHCLTGVPESSCQKMAAGDRPENLELVVGLLRSEHGRDILFALMGEASPSWFVKYRKSLDVNAAFRQLAEAERAIKRLQMEAAE